MVVLHAFVSMGSAAGRMWWRSIDAACRAKLRWSRKCGMQGTATAVCARHRRGNLCWKRAAGLEAELCFVVHLIAGRACVNPVISAGFDARSEKVELRLASVNATVQVILEPSSRSELHFLHKRAGVSGSLRWNRVRRGSCRIVW